MKKKAIVSTLLTISVVSAAIAFGGRSGDKNATGKITQISASSAMCSVDGLVEDGKLWLGYTVYWNDGYEKDYPPVKVKGKFSKTLTYQLRPQGFKKITVALWRYKVSKDKWQERARRQGMQILPEEWLPYGRQNRQ